ncbi:MAG: glycosyltransferase [Patescibacteria group bacterium]
MKNFSDLKVAIIHDQLTQYGGAERTLEQLLNIFPNADIFTGYCKPQNISQKILNQQIFLGLDKEPVWVQKLFNYLSFLMPFVFESFDLRRYNIIISEGTAWPKGVITNPQQLHISYIYTPPRFLYGYATEGQKRDVWYYKPFLKVIDHFLRLWDFSAAQRPDFILSISQEVAKRVKKYYRRDSAIIYPPVDINTQAPQEKTSESCYLCISRLAAYKNIDLLIQAFNKTHLKLKIAGTGKEEAELKTIAGENIEMLGFVNETEKARLLAKCKGFIFPTDYEDFGIVLVEALAHGKPVLSHRSGGPLETIEEGVTGMFFDELNAETLSQKIMKFDKNIDEGKYNEQKARESAKKFSAGRFKNEFGEFVKQRWEEKQDARTS